MAPPEVCTACVGEPAQEAAAAKPGQASGLYEVPLSAHGSGFRTAVAAGEFELVLDAGRALGGQQTGPSPVQAFVGAIVACSQVGGQRPGARYRCSPTRRHGLHAPQLPLPLAVCSCGRGLLSPGRINPRSLPPLPAAATL